MLIGMPGCGKTSVGIKLAEILKWDFTDMDKFIENREKQSINDIFSKKGEKYFRYLETEAAKSIAQGENIVISTGGGVVTISENMEYLKKSGKIFFIDRPLENIIGDIVSDDRPLLKNDREKNLRELYNKRIGLYRKYADYIVKNNADMDFVVNSIRNIIKREGI